MKCSCIGTFSLEIIDTLKSKLQFQNVSMNCNHVIPQTVNFCNRTLQSDHEGEMNCHLVSFSDEAWFHYHGEVDSQNKKYWNLHNLELHYSRTDVLCNVIQTQETVHLNEGLLITLVKYSIKSNMSVRRWEGGWHLKHKLTSRHICT